MPEAFSCHLLDEALAVRHMAREGRRLATLARVQEALARLATRVEFTEAYIFGSLLDSTRFHDDSDVDLAFVGLRDEDFFPAMAWLSRELRREVDLVQLEGHRLEEKVKKEGIRWTRPN